VLAAVEAELQADAELAAAFCAFAGVTASAAMPKVERLPARGKPAGWLAFLRRRVMLVVVATGVLVAVLALTLAACSAGRPAACDRSYAFAPACHGPSGAPVGVAGQVRVSYPPPGYGHR
jgi:hypothetical protein